MKRILLALVLALAVSAEDCEQSPRAARNDGWAPKRMRDDSLKVVCWYFNGGGVSCLPESQLEPRGPES